MLGLPIHIAFHTGGKLSGSVALLKFMAELYNLYSEKKNNEYYCCLIYNVHYTDARMSDHIDSPGEGTWTLQQLHAQTKAVGRFEQP